MDNACTSNAQCTALGLGHAGESCSGPPVPGSANSCAYACVTDSDCTSRGGFASVQASHVGDRCMQNRCMHTHDPLVVAPGALQAVVDKFAEHGINLHIVRGHELPHSHVLSMRLLNDSTYPTNTMTDTCEGGSLASGTAGAGKYAESFYDLKAASFDPRRALEYHYVIFSHYSSSDSTQHFFSCPTGGLNPDGSEKFGELVPGQSGLAEIGGNDFIVSLGIRINDIALAPDIFNVGSTFMHELGHNLGLHHGGGSGLRECLNCGFEDLPDFKPNYLSVMNNLYIFQGITRGEAIGSSNPAVCTKDADCLTGEQCRAQFPSGGVCARLDYSTQTLPTGGNTPGTLDENGNLNESAGLGSGNADLFIFVDGACDAPRYAPTEGPVDFDGDGFTNNTNATADLDSFKHACGTQLKVLIGHTDWGPAPGQSKFLYKFQCTPAGKD